MRLRTAITITTAPTNQTILYIAVSLLLAEVNGKTAKRFQHRPSPRGEVFTERRMSMNTANPQLEGLYLAFASINRLLVGKGLVSHAELDRKSIRLHSSHQ